MVTPPWEFVKRKIPPDFSLYPVDLPDNQKAFA
jgi:hypothetical protein